MMIQDIIISEIMEGHKRSIFLAETRTISEELTTEKILDERDIR